MLGRGHLFLSSTALLLAACAADGNEFGIRAKLDPLTAAAAQSGNPMVVEGRNLLALGSVGLALEAFRKALRQQPDSVEALAGIAACYDAMGRFDLSRAKYEAALAVAPNNIALLNSFAASLEQQGRYGEATALRAEAAGARGGGRSTVTEVVGPTEWRIELPTEARTGSITVPLPPARLSENAPPVAAKVAGAAERRRAQFAGAADPAREAVPVVAASGKGEPAKPEPEPVQRPKATIPAPLSTPPKVAPVRQNGRAKMQPPPVRLPDATVAQPAPAPGDLAGVANTTADKQALTPAEPAKPIRSVPPANPVAASKGEGRLAGGEAEQPDKPALAAAKLVQAEQASAARKEVVVNQEPPPVQPRNLPLASSESTVAETAVEVEAARARPPLPARKSPAQLSDTNAAPSVDEHGRARAASVRSAPRLERLSLGEVALLAGGGPAWRSPAGAAGRQSLTARFVPLRTATAVPNVRLLNAARRRGLAARTRDYLVDKGWRRIAIGDALRVRQTSVVLYPASRQALGRRVAAQFGFRSAVVAHGDEVVVLLGRDAMTARARKRG